MKKLRDPTAWPEWQPEIEEVSGPVPLELGDEVEGVARMLGFGVQGRSAATMVADDTFEEDVIVGVRMKVRYTVRPSGQGSIVTRRLETYLPNGFGGRILSVFLKWRLKRMQEGVLEELTK